MSFGPVIPVGGYAGWRFLQRTVEVQKETFVASAKMQRDEAYFRDRIGGISSAEELVADRRLLQIALGAFGLGEDIGNKYFIRKVLEDGVSERTALANRLSNKAYAEMASTFSFSEDPPFTQREGFADAILAAYKTRAFEAAVGDSNDDMRLALNAQRELEKLAERNGSENTLWYAVLGSKPLRTVFERAFALPSTFGALDIDLQLRTMKSRAQSILGQSSITQFADPEQSEALIRRFLLMSDLQSGLSQNAPGAGALSLLRGQGSAASLLSILRR